MSVLTLDPRVLVLDLRRQNLPAGGAGARLRVGIVAGGRSLPRWTQDFIDWFRSIGDFDTRIYSAHTAIANNHHSSSALFDKLHNYSRTAFDPFTETVNKDAALESARPAAEGSVPDLDILIWLSPDPMPSAAPLRFAKLGALSVELGLNRHDPPYWDEVAGAQILSDATLWWHASTFARARALRKAELSTDQGLRFTRNAEQPLIAIAQMAASICLDMLALGSAWAENAEAIPETDRARLAGGTQTPSTFATARFVCGKLLRSARLRIRRADRPMAWFLALRPNTAHSYARSGKFTAEGFRTVPMTAGAQMADPFLVDHGERTFLFCEEIPPGSHTARLICAEVLEDGTLGAPSVVLETGSHLSYPCVFPHDGEFFMIPESAGARRIDLYRATRFPAEFRLETTFLDDFLAVDTTPLFLDGRWYFFTSSGEPFPQTLLFWSDRLDGRWHLHPRSPVSCSIRNCRAAGAITKVQGRLLRPTQDCSIGYGYAIVMNEILRLTPSEFEERTVDTILPDWLPDLLGTHTLNASSRFEVIDGIRYAQ